MTSRPVPPEPPIPNKKEKMEGRYAAETSILALISAGLPKEKLKKIIEEIENLFSSTTPEESEEFNQGQKEAYEDFLRFFRQINLED